MYNMSLTLVYPIYIFGFVSVSGVSQALFAMMLPIIKLIGRNVLSHILDDHNDVIPEVVVFNVEVFNALYVATALQSVLSYTATATIMIIDLVQFWLSMLDVLQIINDMNKLMEKIPRDKMDFVQVALNLLGPQTHLQVTAMDLLSGLQLTQPAPTLIKKLNGECTDELELLSSPQEMTPVVPTTGSHSKRMLIHKGQVVSINPPLKPINLNAIFSPAERSQFLFKAVHVLFITEYLVLVEYTEVILPIIFSLYRVILFNLPNCSYYPSLAGLSNEQFFASIQNVTVYSALELVSLVVFVYVLQRTLGISPLGQLAFVLETQAGMIQAQLMIWFAYVMSCKCPCFIAVLVNAAMQWAK